MLIPFCFYGMHVVPFCDSEAHKFVRVCVYMPLFCLCNILGTIFQIKLGQKKERKKEKDQEKNEKGLFYFCLF